MADRKKNPLSLIGWYFLIGGLIFFLILWLAGLDTIRDAAVLPVAFGTSFFFAIWVIFQLRTGVISMVTPGGAVQRISLAKNPFLFYGYCISIFGCAVFLAILLGSDLFLGCEASRINTCPATLLP